MTIHFSFEVRPRAGLSGVTPSWCVEVPLAPALVHVLVWRGQWPQRRKRFRQELSIHAWLTSPPVNFALSLDIRSFNRQVHNAAFFFSFLVSFPLPEI